MATPYPLLTGNSPFRTTRVRPSPSSAATADEGATDLDAIARKDRPLLRAEPDGTALVESGSWRTLVTVKDEPASYSGRRLGKKGNGDVDDSRTADTIGRTGSAIPLWLARARFAPALRERTSVTALFVVRVPVTRVGRAGCSGGASGRKCRAEAAEHPRADFRRAPYCVIARRAEADEPTAGRGRVSDRTAVTPT